MASDSFAGKECAHVQLATGRMRGAAGKADSTQDGKENEELGFIGCRSCILENHMVSSSRQGSSRGGTGWEGEKEAGGKKKSKSKSIGKNCKRAIYFLLT